MTDTKKPIQPDPKPKAKVAESKADPKPTDTVTCRVVGPGPLTTPEGVKAPPAKGKKPGPESTFKCSRKQAESFGKLVVIL